MNEIYWRGYQDGRYDGYAEAVAMLEEDYKDSENLAAELRAVVRLSVRLLDWLGSREGTAPEDAREAEEVVRRARAALAASEGQPCWIEDHRMNFYPDNDWGKFDEGYLQALDEVLDYVAGKEEQDG